MLLIRPRALPEESIRGFCFRIAELNGIAGMRQLFEILERDISAFKLCMHVMQSEMLGVIPLADGISKSVQLLHGLPIRFWNLKFARFCPACFSETPVWRRQWELALVVACPKHKVMLVDECSACKKPIQWSRRSFTHCNCGYQLSDCPTQPSFQSGSRLSAVQENALNGIHINTSDYPMLRRFNLSYLSELLFFLGGHFNGIDEVKPLKLTGMYKLEIASLIVEGADEVLQNWPENFDRFLLRLGKFDSEQSEGSPLRKRFGFFYHSLYRNFNGEIHLFLHQAFEDFLYRHWTGLFTRRNSRFSKKLLNSHPYIPLPLAAKTLGVSRLTIKDMINSGQLQAKARMTVSGRTFLNIDQKSVLAARSVRASWLTFTEARTLMGFSKKRFQAAIKSGYIKAEAGPGVDGSAAWKFSKTKMQNKCEESNE